MTEKRITYSRFFWELFRIALLVVGGGYAILLVADDVFGRRLKWIREGELTSHLPVFQMIPGLIAGNTAIYLGLKLFGRLGAALGLVAVALPSLIIFLIVACGYDAIPIHNEWLESIFLGLRSSLTGVILGSIVKSWRKSVSGVYGYAAMAICTLLLTYFHVSTVQMLLAAMAAGLILEYCGLGKELDQADSGGIALKPLSRKERINLVAGIVAFVAFVTVFYRHIFWFFVRFGLICFGGGLVLIPAYMDEFVGPDAPFLNLPMKEFSNLIALTQMTPGPVSVNSATFFGFRLGGVVGSIVATAGLLVPSLFLLTSALTCLEKWKRSRIVRGILNGVRPATISLMIATVILFAGMSIWQVCTEVAADGTLTMTRSFSLLACALAAFTAYVIFKKKMSVMASIFMCAFISLAVHGAMKYGAAVERASTSLGPSEMERYQWPVMGTIAEFSTRDADDGQREREREIVANAFREVERDLSVFADDSDLERLNRERRLVTGKESNICRVLSFALEIADSSGGAFDPTVNPLMRLWGFRGGIPAIPSPAEVSNTLQRIGYRHVQIRQDGTNVVIEIDSPEIEIDLGGIAKGYAVDLAFDRLQANCASNFLLNLGGNIRVCGTPAPNRNTWNIDVRDPSNGSRVLPLDLIASGEAVATSGSYERFVEIDGQRFSHIIDPRTGMPVDNGLGSATVVAKSAMEADACSTTAFVLGRRDGEAFLKTRAWESHVFLDVGGH